MLLTREFSEETKDLPSIVDSALAKMDNLLGLGLNKATSLAKLYAISGEFIQLLNNMAPRKRRLENMLVVLDSPNPNSTETALRPLEGLARPDLQLYVKGCLVLRWENKLHYNSLPEAMRENSKKLKTWSSLFYGALPYVIGGFCAGHQFQWLRLSPDLKGNMDYELISPIYDLTSLMGVAAFLHSNIRMHGLLQKLQERLKNDIKCTLYRQKDRGKGVTVTIYPNLVQKEIVEDENAMRASLYMAIKHSKYLIHGEVRRKRKSTLLLLKPVGDPCSEPVTLTELENATHDILCGLDDLHRAGYTHRDVRWENCIKVNLKGEWKWILIDLEAAGAVGEDCTDSKPLTIWDDDTLEKRTKKYAKASDHYLLGKLISKWLAEMASMDEKLYQVMTSTAEKMMAKSLSAVKLKKLFCKPSCQRCKTFGLQCEPKIFSPAVDRKRVLNASGLRITSRQAS